jgi:excisionase family DNA binding protein
MQVNGTRMLRVRSVADMFDVSTTTIYRAVEAGKLDALRIGSRKGGAIRIPESALAAYAEECAEAAYQAFVVGGKSAESVDQAGDAISGEVR